MKISFRFIRHQQWFREVHVHIVQRATRVLRQVDHNQIRQVGKSQLWWLQNERDHWRDNRTSALRQNVEVQHVRRSANRVAHVLAKYAISQLLNNTWIDECPNIIQNVVVADYECTTWLSFYNIHWFSKKKKKKGKQTQNGSDLGTPTKYDDCPRISHKLTILSSSSFRDWYGPIIYKWASWVWAHISLVPTNGPHEFDLKGFYVKCINRPPQNWYYSQ
jgi:hypothetical protein